METYTIRPFAGAYRVEATAPDGKRRLVETCASEEAAVLRLRLLQEKSGAHISGQFQERDGRQ